MQSPLPVDVDVSRSSEFASQCLRPSLLRRTRPGPPAPNAPKQAWQQRQQRRTSPAGSELSLCSERAVGQAAMVAKALARVMQLQQERDRLLQDVQVTNVVVARLCPRRQCCIQQSCMCYHDLQRPQCDVICSASQPKLTCMPCCVSLPTKSCMYDMQLQHRHACLPAA